MRSFGSYFYHYFVFSLLVIHNCITSARCKLKYKDCSTQYPGALEKVLSSIAKIPDKQVCVWYSPRGGGVEEEVIKYLVSSYKIVASFQRDQVNMVPPFCRHNVLLTNGSRVLGLLAPSLPLTAYHHYYVLVLGYLNAKDLANSSAQFGIARAAFVSLLETRVFELSSPLFWQRSFLISNLSSAIRHESMSHVNLKGRPVIVASFHCPPFVIFHEKNGTNTITGIEWEVLRSIASMMNFTIKLATLKGEAKWGHLENGSWTGGITLAMYDDVAEIGVCNMWYTLDTHQIMDFAMPLNVVKFTFIVPRPKPLNHNWKSLVQVFDKHVWGLIGVLYFFYTIAYWQFSAANDSLKRSKPGMVKSSLTMFGMLMGTSWPSHGESSSTRQLLTWWSVFVLLFSSTYNTSIASRFTLQGYEQRIDTIQQLIEHDFFWADTSYYNDEKRTTYFNLANHWQIEWVKRFVLVSRQYMKKKLDSGKFAFPIQRWGDRLLFFVVEGLDIRRDLKGMRVVKETTTFTYESMKFHKRSPLFKASQVAILRVVEAGLIKYWTKLVSRAPENWHYNRLLLEDEGRTGAKKLGLNNLGPVFFLLCVGLLTGLLVFISESLCKSVKAKFIKD